MASSNGDRVVVLIDMDCFFCQVETKLRPEYKGKPLAVVQYNQWQLGGIIAVNYEAREFGVTRHMRGDEAKEKCPDLVLASVPCLRGKSDTSRYRTAGRDVINVIRNHCSIIERASVDEAYLDITEIVDQRMAANLVSAKQLEASLPNTFVVGYSETGNNDEGERSKGTRTWLSNVFDELEDLHAQKLAVGSVIVEELRADIYEKTGFRCSAGIAQNKILAKLACGLHKPNRQTILPATAISTLFSTLPIKKVRNLGGKFGDVVVESLNCNVMADLLQYSLQYLQKRFDDKTGLWLYNIARGTDNEPVTKRLLSKSIGACKKFPGKQAITSLDVLKHWVGELSLEVCERLEQDLDENERRATLLTICYHYYQKRSTISQSRSYTLNSYKSDKMADRCVEIITKSTQCPVAFIGLSAGKFIPAKGCENFMNFFKKESLDGKQRQSTGTEDGNRDFANLSNNVDEPLKCGLPGNNATSRLTNTENCSEVETKTDRRACKTDEQPRERHFSAKKVESPTSTRVNKLIKTLNERNKAETLYRNDVNKCNVNESLDQDKIKGSFFMNIFNKKDSKSECIAAKTETNRLNDNYNVETEHERDEFHENNMKRDTVNNESQREITETNTVQTSIQLHEIFPDLNNIDSSVVSLLPLDLQKEAKLYIKMQEKSNLKLTETVTKTSKGKSNKTKANIAKRTKGNSMYTFLTKGISCDVRDDTAKRCPQCQQMISITKYDEHGDFHVAEELQRKLNSESSNSAGVKRKIDTSDINESSLKRRPLIDIFKRDNNCQTITGFLVD